MRRQPALSTALLAVAVILVMAAFRARADQPPAYAFQAEVTEVRLAFVATDQHNRDVPTITPVDIAVVDDGVVIRRFRSLSRYPQLNLDVLVLVDASESLARQFSQEIAQTTRLLREARWEPDDAVSIMSFGGLQPGLLCLRNCRDLPPAAWISKIHAQGQTPLFDAVIRGVDFLSKDRNPNYRPVLVILSDGDDTISAHSVRDAVVAAQRAEVPIYTFNTGDLKNVAGGNILRGLAALTGGLNLGGTSGASSDLASVVEDLRNAYVLTYDLPNHVEGLHSVSILPTRNSNLRLRSRQAYFYAGEHASAQRGWK